MTGPSPRRPRASPCQRRRRRCAQVGLAAAVNVELTYTFHPDDYRIDVSGRATGVGSQRRVAAGGNGPNASQHRSRSSENHRALALVTKRQRHSSAHDFGQTQAGRAQTVSGPFEWAAVKSKYFVTGCWPDDTHGRRHQRRHSDRGSGPRASARPGPRCGSAFRFLASGRLRLSACTPDPWSTIGWPGMGHDFDDVNPYGWPGFRTVIRPVAAGVRWLLVWMHEHLHLAYGLVLIFFGILVRLLLWPLNQKAMRANMQHAGGAAPHEGDPGEVQERSPDGSAGDVQAVQGTRGEPAGRLLADAAADAGAVCALLRVSEHDRAPRAHPSSGCPTSPGPTRSTSSRW